MTDDEVAELLLSLGSRRVARHQRREPGYEVSAEAPSGIEGDIEKLLWYVGMKPSRNELLTLGATPLQAEKAFAYYKCLFRVTEPSDLVPIPPDLASAIEEDLKMALSEEPAGGPQRLDEKWIKEITECRVEIYHNEGQHRGRPHVVVKLQDGKVSVSLDDPPELLTPHGYRGEAGAVKIVGKHRKRLRQIWDESRPDDQKLPTPQDTVT